ncbi:ribonuclease Z [Persicobacter psychrovividus]|uniref:Ribonuclease Z n=1 Tax=Persicobacter psychrovividus TaxID=387638 RepID=A0ABN6L9B1_9BACT|nr:ribonuclease Z [Persicobacter psychrovividus]
MAFKVLVLGSNAAAPALNKFNTSQLITIDNHHLLIDCGEGAQLQLIKYRAKLAKISHIFISHMHGDHYFGLIGLLSTMHLFKKKGELHLYGPPELAEVITVQLKASMTFLNYRLVFHVTNGEVAETILETSKFSVTSIPLAHQIHCTGFLIKEQPHQRRINKAKMPYDLSLENIGDLKSGRDTVYKNRILSNQEYTLPPQPSFSYAYCSDTLFTKSFIEQIKGVDLLYHEATFMHDMEARAKVTHHSTTKQAATIAKMANVKQLMIGHFSIRYNELDPLLEEAREVFEQTILGVEGTKVYLRK